MSQITGSAGIRTQLNQLTGVPHTSLTRCNSNAVTLADQAQEATAGPGAELELGFLAHDVYLVLGGGGMLSVSFDGRHTQTIDIAGVPGLYTLYRASASTTGTLLLRASPGVEAYDFTFG